MTKRPRIKDTPLRMCVSCRQMMAKQNMYRVVRTPDGYKFDAENSADGRGAYVCKNSNCVQLCLNKKLFNRAFKTEVSDDVYKALSEAYANRQA